MKNEYIKKTVETFLADLQERKSVPGGGSAAALAGALGAAMHLMVLAYSEKEIEPALRESLICKQQGSLHALARCIDEDAAAFGALMKGLSRKADVQEKYKASFRVPLEVANRSLASLELLAQTRQSYNTNLITDLGGAAHALESAVKQAFLNAKINLAHITDETFTAKMDKRLAEIVSRAESLAEDTILAVKKEMT